MRTRLWSTDLGSPPGTGIVIWNVGVMPPLRSGISRTVSVAVALRAGAAVVSGKVKCGGAESLGAEIGELNGGRAARRGSERE